MTLKMTGAIHARGFSRRVAIRAGAEKKEAGAPYYDVVRALLRVLVITFWTMWTMLQNVSGGTTSAPVSRVMISGYAFAMKTSAGLVVAAFA